MLTVRQALDCMDLLRELLEQQVNSEIKFCVCYFIISLLGGAGGDSGDAGQCPAASPLSDAECAGAVSTCWSPGQRDTDCPNNGLCCVSRLLIF